MIKYSRVKKMNNKCVLITGATGGLGSSLVEKFAKNNYNIVINYYSNEEKALYLKNKYENEYGIRCLVVKCDISNDEEVLKMYDLVKEEFGVLDVLINNAAISIDSEFESKTKENFNKIFNTNVYSVYLLSKTFGKDMFERKKGSIINIASNNAIDSYYEYGADYDASKAAVVNLSHNIASHFAPYIRVNCVCPGWINTPMNKELDNEFKEEEYKKILLNRFAEPYEIANLVYFLSTEEASYINDSVIKIDGGKKC